MKKSALLLFPLLFSLLTLSLFLFIYHPARGSPGTASACLVFLTSLGWSALIVFGRRGMKFWKAVYAAAALAASVLLIEVIRPFPVDPLQHRLMVAVQVLGMAGIVVYLRILKNKGETS